MKLTLKNNSNLVLTSISQKNKISGLIIDNCPNVSVWNIAKSILDTTGNILSRVRLTIGTALTDLYTNLSKFFSLGGYDSTGAEIEKPAISGTLNIDQWVLESERTTAINTINNEFTLVTPNIAYDVEEQLTGKNYLHFHEVSTSAPIIDSSTFDFANYTKIYVGLGDSHYYDNNILTIYKRDWYDLTSKLDSWYNYLNRRDIPVAYDLVESIMSDRVRILDTGITNPSYILVDVAYNLKPTGTCTVMGNRESGFKGTTSGLYFGSHSYISGSDYQEDSTERLYEADLSTNKYSLNNVEIATTSSGVSQAGGITLFGDLTTKEMATLYGCKLKNSSQELLANYIPVIRISDKIPGLYDLTSGTFKNLDYYYCEGAERKLTTEDNENITTESGEEILI